MKTKHKWRAGQGSEFRGKKPRQASQQAEPQRRYTFPSRALGLATRRRPVGGGARRAVDQYT